MRLKKKGGIFLWAIFLAVGYFLILNFVAPRRVACVGDSITLAMGGYGKDYPTLLGHKLGFGFKVRNFGYGGTTVVKNGDTPYLRMPVFAQSIAWAPDEVVIMLGTNDSKPYNWAYKNNFEENLKEMIGYYQTATAHTKIYLVLPCPAFNKPSSASDGAAVNGKNVEDEIIPLIRRVAAETGLEIIDVHTPLKIHPEYFYDGVHPDVQGTELIAETIFKGMQPQHMRFF